MAPHHEIRSVPSQPTTLPPPVQLQPHWCVGAWHEGIRGRIAKLVKELEAELVKELSRERVQG